MDASNKLNSDVKVHLADNKLPEKSQKAEDNKVDLVANAIREKVCEPSEKETKKAKKTDGLYQKSEEQEIYKNAIAKNVEMVLHSHVTKSEPKQATFWDNVPTPFREDPISVISTVLLKAVDKIPIVQSGFFSSGNIKEIKDMKKVLNEIVTNESIKKELNSVIIGDIDKGTEIEKNQILKFLECLKRVDEGNLKEFFSLLVPLLRIGEIDFEADIKYTNYKLFELLSVNKLNMAMLFAKPFLKMALNSADFEIKVKDGTLKLPALKAYVLDNYDAFYSIAGYGVSLLEEPEIKNQLDKSTNDFYGNDLVKLRKDLVGLEQLRDAKQAEIDNLNQQVFKIDRDIEEIHKRFTSPKPELFEKSAAAKSKIFQNMEKCSSECFEIKRKIKNIEDTIQNREKNIVESSVINTGVNLSRNKKSTIVACAKTFVDTTRMQ